MVSVLTKAPAVQHDSRPGAAGVPTIRPGAVSRVHAVDPSPDDRN